MAETKHDKTKRFWMCLIDGCITGCKQRHYNYEEARKEAERLVNKEGKGVVILEAVEYCRPPILSLEWFDLA